MTDHDAPDDELFAEWSPTDQQRVHSILDGLSSTSSAPPFDRQAQWSRIQAATRPIAQPRVRPAAPLRTLAASNQGTTFSHRARTIWGALGVACVVAVMAFGIHTIDIRTAQTFVTNVGQRKTIRLADGSHVTLAPQSRLVVARGFGRASRTVTLSGEGYFDVNTATTSPFVVQTGDITTRVLGTRFDVRRYPEENVVAVTVVAGRVAVSGEKHGTSSLTVSAGFMAQLADSGNATPQVIAMPDAEAATAWTRGYVVLHDAPAREALATLTRWYGYHFTIADSTLANQRLNVWLSTQSSGEALRTLKLALDVDLFFDQSNITVRPHRAVPSRRQRPRSFLSTPNSEAGR